MYFKNVNIIYYKKILISNDFLISIFFFNPLKLYTCKKLRLKWRKTMIVIFTDSFNFYFIGERPFRCDVTSCGKTFTRNEELTRHKRIHSGLRPFPCTECGKRFGRKDHLKKHARTHAQHRAAAAVAAVYGMPMSVIPLPAMIMPSTPTNISATPTATMAYEHWTQSHPAMGFLPPMTAPHPSQPPVLYGYWCLSNSTLD